MTVSSRLDVIMWSKGLAEATGVPRDAVERQHISALPFTDKAALDEVCRVRVSGIRCRCFDHHRCL